MQIRNGQGNEEDLLLLLLLPNRFNITREYRDARDKRVFNVEGREEEAVEKAHTWLDIASARVIKLNRHFLASVAVTFSIVQEIDRKNSVIYRSHLARGRFMLPPPPIQLLAV